MLKETSDETASETAWPCINEDIIIWKPSVKPLAPDQIERALHLREILKAANSESS